MEGHEALAGFVSSSGSLLSEQILERLRHLLELIVQFRFKSGKLLALVRRFLVQPLLKFCDLLPHVLSPFIESSIHLVLGWGEASVCRFERSVELVHRSRVGADGCVKWFRVDAFGLG